VRSAHDLANGGLAIALAECSMRGFGVDVDLSNYASELDAIALLFSESQARAVVACTNDRTDAVIARASAFGVPARMIGKTTNAAFLIQRNGIPLIRTSTPELARIWRRAFALLLGGDSIEDVIRGVGEEAPEVMAH